MKRIALVLALAALPAICGAEIYQWVDDRGQVGYADDLGKVPAKYRKKATMIGNQEQAVEIVEQGEADKNARKGGEPRKEREAEEKSQAKEKEKPLYDGRDGASWKRDFARQNNEVRSLEENVASLKTRMASPASLSRGEYLSLQNTLRDVEFRLTNARKKLEDLNRAADRADLPSEFRQ